MTVQQINSNISDDSDDMVSLPSEEEIYRRKYQLLLERCEVLQQDNERIINRFVFWACFLLMNGIREWASV